MSLVEKWLRQQINQEKIADFGLATSDDVDSKINAAISNLATSEEVNSKINSVMDEVPVVEVQYNNVNKFIDFTPIYNSMNLYIRIDSKKEVDSEVFNESPIELEGTMKLYRYNGATSLDQLPAASFIPSEHSFNKEFLEQCEFLEEMPVSFSGTVLYLTIDSKLGSLTRGTYVRTEDSLEYHFYDEVYYPHVTDEGVVFIGDSDIHFPVPSVVVNNVDVPSMKTMTDAVSTIPDIKVYYNNDTYKYSFTSLYIGKGIMFLEYQENDSFKVDEDVDRTPVYMKGRMKVYKHTTSNKDDDAGAEISANETDEHAFTLDSEVYKCSYNKTFLERCEFIGTYDIELYGEMKFGLTLSFDGVDLPAIPSNSIYKCDGINCYAVSTPIDMYDFFDTDELVALRCSRFLLSHPSCRSLHFEPSLGGCSSKS